MLHENNLIVDPPENEWAERNEHWLAETNSNLPSRKRRERNSIPLILCGHGMSLRVEHGSLIVRDGFTHYPKQQAAHRFFPGSRDIPERILLLDGSGTLSFDVLSWLAEQGVALARVKWTGDVATVASGTGFASDREKVLWQRDTLADAAKRIAYAANLIRTKLAASITTLQSCFPRSARLADAIDLHKTGADRLAGETFKDMNDIRAIEGQCAAMYFAVWQDLALDWKGRKPIPDDWRSFSLRSSVANVATPQNRNASHPVNAMLNYAYTVKLAQMQIQAIADGYDPTIGIMHHGRRGKPAYIFDLIEPERPKVDAIILTFINSRSFSGADFVIRTDGVCRLSPQLARAISNLIVK